MSHSVGELDPLDDDLGQRPVRTVRGRGGDGVDDGARLGVGDLTEDGVPAVEVRGRRHGDEELRAVRAGAGVRHGEQVGAVEPQVRVELVGELVAGAAAAGARRVAALDHEAADHAVEDRAVVERAGVAAAGVGLGVGLLTRREADEVRHRLRGVVREQVDPDVTLGRPQRRGGLRIRCSHDAHRASTRGRASGRTRRDARPGVPEQGESGQPSRRHARWTDW